MPTKVEFLHADQIGDIKVTPFTIYHSAEAAMMFVIETPEKRIFHMGDFRTHGYMVDKMKKLLHYYVLRHKPIDILITEGMNLSRISEGALLTEGELYEEACKLINSHKLVVCLCASTNFVRLQSFYKAARRAHKCVLANCYIKQQLSSYYKYKKDLYEYLHPGKAGKEYQPRDIYTLLLDKDDLQENALYKLQDARLRKNGAVIFVSGTSAVSSLEKLLAKYGELEPLLIYSLWDGYIKDKGAEYYNEKLAKVCVTYNSLQLHTSGHASKETLEKLIKLVAAKYYTAIIHSKKAEIIKS